VLSPVCNPPGCPRSPCFTHHTAPNPPQHSTTVAFPPGHQATRRLLPPPNCRPSRGVSTRPPRSLQNHWTPPPRHGIGPCWTPPPPHAPAPPQLLPTIPAHHTQQQTLLVLPPVVLDLTGPDLNKSPNTLAPLPRSRAPQVYRNKVVFLPSSGCSACTTLTSLGHIPPFRYHGPQGQETRSPKEGWAPNGIPG